MTVEEAKEYLLGKYLVVGSPVNPSAGECEKHNAAIDIAIAALDTQIPQKVVRISAARCGTPYRCPKCEADVIPVEFIGFNGEGMFSWCSDCGQKLDWSEGCAE